MGQFTDITDMQKQYQANDLVRLSNEDGSSAITVNEGVINDCITEGEAFVKSFIRVKYNIDDWTTTTVPYIVKQIAREMAFYLLNQRKYNIGEQLKNKYDENVETLGRLRDGKQVLDTDPDDTVFESRPVQDCVSTYNSTTTYDTEATI